MGGIPGVPSITNVHNSSGDKEKRFSSYYKRNQGGVETPKFSRGTTERIGSKIKKDEVV